MTSPAPVLLRERPQLRLVPGELEVVAQLSEPLMLEPGEARELWLPWPLAVVVGHPGGLELLRERPTLRRTLLGQVDSGRVLPAVLVASLGTDIPEPGPNGAALKLRITNAGSHPARLRRFPVDEASLEVARLGKQLLMGCVDVALFDGDRATSRALALAPPFGSEPIPRLPRPERGERAGLDWLLDSTRRSVQFQT